MKQESLIRAHVLRSGFRASTILLSALTAHGVEPLEQEYVVHKVRDLEHPAKAMCVGTHSAVAVRTADNRLHSISESGKLMWTHRFDAPVTCVSADKSPRGHRTVASASSNGREGQHANGTSASGRRLMGRFAARWERNCQTGQTAFSHKVCSTGYIGFRSLETGTGWSTASTRLICSAGRLLFALSTSSAVEEVKQAGRRVWGILPQNRDSGLWSRQPGRRVRGTAGITVG